MSKYTTEVRFICEEFAGLDASVGFSKVDGVIEKARPKIFDFFYPIFKEEYRPILETKILRHFYTKEIGFETVGLWQLKLETKLNEIMPYFNKLYESELLKFDPFTDTDYQRIFDGTINRTGHDTNTGSSEGTSGTLSKLADTPQDSVSNLLNDKYLSSAQKDDSETHDSYSNTVESSHKDLDHHTENVIGKVNSASYMSLLKELRETFLNIDMMVIDELEDLFMKLW